MVIRKEMLQSSTVTIQKYVYSDFATNEQCYLVKN